MDCCSLNSLIPVAFIFLGFETLHQFQEFVFRFIMERIDLVKSVFRDLICYLQADCSCQYLGKRAQGNVKVLKIFTNRSAAIYFGNIPGNRLCGICNLSAKFIIKLNFFINNFPYPLIQLNCLLPHLQLHISPVSIAQLGIFYLDTSLDSN